MRINLLFLFFFTYLLSQGENRITESSSEDYKRKTVDSVLVKQNTQELIDSLTIETNINNKVKISLNIAWGLKDNEWKRCTQYITIAENSAIVSKDNILILETFNKIADIYYYKDFLDISLEYYVKAYNTFDNKADNPFLHKLENDIAIIAARLNDAPKALYFFNKVYKYNKSIFDSLKVAKTYNNIGLLFIDNKLDSSLYFFNKSLKLAQIVSDTTLIAYVSTNLGRVYSLKKDTLNADFYHKQALYYSKYQQASDKAWIYIEVSKWLITTGLEDSAIFYLNKSLRIINQNKYTFSYKDANKLLYQAYLVKGEYKLASHYFVIYDKTRDSLNIEEKAVNVEKIKLEQEYLIKERQRNREEDKRKTNYLIIGFSLILGLLISFIFLLRSRSRLRETKLEKKLIEAKKDEFKYSLQAKNQELIAKAMKDISRTEFIEEILVELKQISLKAVKKETQQAISSIQKQIQKESNSNIWEEFELSFKDVHENFYNNLSSKHPDITSKDKRLCALLVLNLSSKEIAQITGQDFKSVENSRTRLRKKLDLTNTKSDLISYLNELK